MELAPAWEGGSCQSGSRLPVDCQCDSGEGGSGQGDRM